MKRQQEKNGFTLIELVIAMALTAIVLGLSTTLVYSYVKISRTIEGNDADLRAASILEDALRSYVDEVNADQATDHITLSADYVLTQVTTFATGKGQYNLPSALAEVNKNGVVVRSARLSLRTGSLHTVILSVHLTNRDFDFSMTFLKEVTS